MLRLTMKIKYVLWNMYVNEDGFIWSQLKAKFIDFYLLLSYRGIFFPSLLNFHFEMQKTAPLCQISHTVFAK